LTPVVRLPDLAIFQIGDAAPHSHLFIAAGHPGDGEPPFDLAADDLPGLRAMLADSGVECSPIEHSEITGHDSFSFVDPEGNRIGVVTPHHSMPAA